tara:strand:+ start:1323 stop:1610 length:288 start_codon:yes stop_codon:yes gene_type:complete
MESKTINNLIMGGGCLVIAFAFFYGNRNQKTKLVSKNKAEYELPEKFINDVNQMNNDELDKAISENTKYLQNSKMLPQTREAIQSMLKHLEGKRG